MATPIINPTVIFYCFLGMSVFTSSFHVCLCVGSLFFLPHNIKKILHFQTLGRVGTEFLS